MSFKETVKNCSATLSKTMAAVSSAVGMVLIRTQNVFADNDLQNIGKLINDVKTTPDASKNPFGSLTNTTGNITSSGYALFMKIAVGIIICGFIAAGISIAVNGSGQKTEQNKGWIGRLVVAGVIIFGAVSIVTMLSNIGVNLFG